jgi:hypothetical protein
MKSFFRLKRLWLLLLVPAAFFLNLAASADPRFAERYAVTVYPVLSRSVNWVTSLFPFSLAEIFVFLFSLGIILYFIRYTVRIIRGKGKRLHIAAKGLLNLLCLAGVIYFIYTITCGINYSRYTFSQTSGFEVKPSSKEELIGLCNELAEKSNESREKVQTDGRNVMKLSTNQYDTAKQAQMAFDEIGKKYPLLQPGYGPPKPLVCSRLLSYCDITGIFFPFTFEANINADVPHYCIPLTMCHELSHLRGYMREDEANFVGYLVCKNSSSDDFRYSGYLTAFIYASNALYSTDSSAAKQVYAKLSSGVLTDLSNNSAYWKQFEGPVAQVSSSVNDTYLRANKQQDGVKSYGRMVDLLLAEYRAEQKGK